MSSFIYIDIVSLAQNHDFCAQKLTQNHNFCAQKFSDTKSWFLCTETDTKSQFLCTETDTKPQFLCTELLPTQNHDFCAQKLEHNHNFCAQKICWSILIIPVCFCYLIGLRFLEKFTEGGKYNLACHVLMFNLCKCNFNLKKLLIINIFISESIYKSACIYHSVDR